MKNLPQKVRSKKLSSRVDLTAMVSVSFFANYIFYGYNRIAKKQSYASKSARL